MKCTRIVLTVALILITQACQRSQPPQANTPPTKEQLSQAVQSTSCERAIATQNRINRYFHHAVVPRVKDCWQRLKGKGTIAVEFDYQREKDGWATDKLKIERSTLPEGQESVALQCLQDSVRGTSFPVEQDDGQAEQFMVHWSWPVPLPKDANEVAQLMSGGGGGGRCGPLGVPPACHDCLSVLIFGKYWLACGPACAGYSFCIQDPDGCRLGPISPRCVTGWLGGTLGGIVMY